RLLHRRRHPRRTPVGISRARRAPWLVSARHFRVRGPMAYAELHCLSNFTFLRGASHPHELVEQADSLGYAALAITDECSVAGVVRAHMAARDRRLKLLIGSEFGLICGLKLVA